MSTAFNFKHKHMHEKAFSKYLLSNFSAFKTWTSIEFDASNTLNIIKIQKAARGCHIKEPHGFVWAFSIVVVLLTSLGQP